MTTEAQPRTSPIIAAVQASMSALWCQPTLECPVRTYGKAHMSPKVPALPINVTSIRLAPARASPTAVRVTKPFRAMAITATGSGTASTARMPITEVAERIRSAWWWN